MNLSLKFEISFVDLSQIISISKSSDLKEILFVWSFNSNISPLFVSAILTFLTQIQCFLP